MNRVVGNFSKINSFIEKTHNDGNVSTKIKLGFDATKYTFFKLCAFITGDRFNPIAKEIANVTYHIKQIKICYDGCKINQEKKYSIDESKHITIQKVSNDCCILRSYRDKKFTGYLTLCPDEFQTIIDDLKKI